MKKIISALLLLACLLLLVPCALAADTAGQIVYGSAGGEHTVTYPGNLDEGEFDFTLRKQIFGTDINGNPLPENFFDIELQVDTHSYDLETTTDVVIVLDISNTMNANIGSDSATRIAAAKDATKTFVDYFNNSSKLDSRNLALVTFNTHAQTVMGLTDMKKSANVAAMKNAINGVSTSYSGQNYTNNRYTNIEAGLQLAYNLLKNRDTKYKYVVLITDGFPTTYIESGRNSTSGIAGYPPYSSSAKNTTADGYFANTLNAKHIPSSGGTSYSDKGAQKARAVANTIKAAGINLISVGVDLSGQSIPDMLGRAPSIVDTVGIKKKDGQPDFEIGTSTDEYKTWLGDVVSGGPYLTNRSRYFDAPSETALEKNIANILNAIETIPVLETHQFYVTDPMSADTEFMQFYNKDGRLVRPTKDAAGNTTASALSGKSGANAEDTASFSSALINWNLMTSGYTAGSKVIDGATVTTYTYTLRYRVRLRNEKDNFAFGVTTDTNTKDASYAHAANNPTLLNWTYQAMDGGMRSKSKNFPVPQAEGYKGRLQFTKVDEDNQPLAGAGFTLTHLGESCPVCQGAAEGFPTPKSGNRYYAKSGQNGIVSFENIPSGHEYLLHEADLPEGYSRVHDHAVTVKYGETIVGSQTLANGQFQNVPNDKAEPVEITFKFRKTLDGETAAQPFAFRLSGQTEHGTPISAIVHNDENGVATLPTLVFDTAGLHTLTLTEIPGEDETLVFDGQTHTITLDVYHPDNHEANDWHADVSINGGEETTYTGLVDGKHDVVHTIWLDLESAPAFKNETRKPASATLEATKSLSGAALTDGKFTYELRDSEGNLLQTAVNDADGGVFFEPISYSASGEYFYTITEKHFKAGIDDPFTHDPDFFYDSTIWDAKVTVTAPDDLTNGAAFAADVIYYRRANTDENWAATPPKFENALKKSAALTIRALKTLDGEAPKDHIFDFELLELTRNADGTVTETVIDTAKSDPHGIIAFDRIVYAPSADNPDHTPVGEYDYRVREVIPEKSAEQIVYDPVVYDLTVIVDDHNSRQLDVSVMVYQQKPDAAPVLIASYLSDEVLLLTAPGAPEAEDQPMLFTNLTYDLPATGDDRPMLPWLLALALSAAALAMLPRRREN